jgi:hypothetical protein
MRDAWDDEIIEESHIDERNNGLPSEENAVNFREAIKRKVLDFYK